VPKLLRATWPLAAFLCVAIFPLKPATPMPSYSIQALRYATKDVLKKGCVVPALGDRTDTFMDSFRRARENYSRVRLGTVLGRVMRTRSGRVGVIAGWVWLGLHFLAR